jgi:hypothetical protein
MAQSKAGSSRQTTHKAQKVRPFLPPGHKLVSSPPSQQQLRTPRKHTRAHIHTTRRPSTSSAFSHHTCQYAARQDTFYPCHGHWHHGRADRVRHLPGWLRGCRHRLLRGCWSNVRHRGCSRGSGCHCSLQLGVWHLPGSLCCRCSGTHPLIWAHDFPRGQGRFIFDQGMKMLMHIIWVSILGSM